MHRFVEEKLAIKTPRLSSELVSSISAVHSGNCHCHCHCLQLRILLCFCRDCSLSIKGYWALPPTTRWKSLRRGPNKIWADGVTFWRPRKTTKYWKTIKKMVWWYLKSRGRTVDENSWRYRIMKVAYILLGMNEGWTRPPLTTTKIFSVTKYVLSPY